MLSRIFGIRRVDMEEEKIHGYSLQTVHAPPKTDTTVEGEVIDKIFIRDGSGLELPKFVFGNVYDLHYEVDGKRAFLDSINEVDQKTKEVMK